MACSLPVALTICRSVAFRLFHFLGEIISHFEFHILLMWADNRTEQILFSARKFCAKYRLFAHLGFFNPR